MTETEVGCRVYVVNTPVPDEIKDIRVDNAFHKELRDEFMDSREEPIKPESCSLLSTIARLYSLMSRSDKLRLLGIFAATLILSMIETVGISVIMPFITLATSPERILDNKYSSAVYHFFGFTSTLHFMVVFAGCLIGFYIFRALYNIYYSYVTNLFSFYHYHSFSLRLFGKILETTCLRFEFTSKDRIRQIVTAEAQNTANFIQQILSFLSNIWTAGMLYMLLIATNWKMTLVLTTILGIQVLLVTKVMSRITKRQGRVRTKLDQEFLGLLTRTFGNFRITKLRGNQSKLFEMFDKTSTKRGRSSVLIGTLSPVPKNILETVAFSLLVASVAYILTRYDDASHVLPIISMYALALYRLLPAITSLMDRYQSMLYAQNSVNIVWETLHKTGEDAGTDMLEFNESIVLEDIDFGYSKERLVLQKVNLTINKGDRVAFTGMSGAGKSTLVDLIIGIYHPKGGKILIDGVEITPRNIDTWRRKIGYIPQQIFLYDGTVAQNIAFGDKEDEEKIINACKQANIYSFLEGHQGIHTKIGEGGVKLSGGQLQRIGIARALYNDPEVLVLDEATSALDSDTEGKVMDELYKTCEGKTMLAISHKPSTLSRCNVNVKVLSVGRAS